MEKCSAKVMDFSRTVRNGFGSAVKNIGKMGVALAGISFAGITAGFIGAAEATEEYRKAMGKLNTAYQAAGYSSETAQKAYSGFYEILGDTDTATEASQLLSKLTRNQEDVTKWTRIAAGVNGTFGDSLPIEGLIEASNETAKVGQVTGVLADALNWSGISEDEFNERLAACGSEAQRNNLIMTTLSKTYEGAAAAFYENNKALIQNRRIQIAQQKITGEIGEASASAKAKMWELLGVTADGSIAAGSVLETVTQKVQEFKRWIENIDVSKYVPIITNAIQSVQQGISTAWKVIGPILGFALQHANVLIPAILGVGAAMSSISVVSDIANKVSALKNLSSGFSTISKAASGFAKVIGVVGTALKALFISPVGAAILIIAALIAAIFLACKAISWLVDNFDKVKEVASKVFGYVKNFVMTIVDAFKALGTEIKDAFVGAFTWVKKKIQPIVDWISKKVEIIKNGFKAVKNFFGNAWENVKGFFVGKKSAGESPTETGHATGTPYFRGGLTRVNEGGRGEIMNLPNGTQIIPHDVAKKQQKTNNVQVQVTIQGNVIGNRAFMEQTGAYIANKILIAQGVV